MPLPAPYSKADDAALVLGCIDGDEDAWDVLRDRHGALITVVALRVLDERRRGEVAEAPIVVDRVLRELRRNDAGPLRVWDGRSSLRHYLAVLTRQTAITHVQDETPIAALVAPPPTPLSIFLDDLVGDRPAVIADALDRLGPQVMAVVRLRLRGLGASDVAAALGTSERSIQHHLERTAEKLGELSAGRPDPDSVLAWRVLLDCASPEERVRCALRTEEDAALLALRRTADATWRAVRERALALPAPILHNCLDAPGLATFGDGSMRGAARARAEGHLNTCGRCTDAVAMLVLDMRTLDVLREASGRAPILGVAAACIATQRFRAGEALCLRAREDGHRRAELLLRLARAGLLLEGSVGDPAPSQPSGVIQTATLPSDDEAPLVALEALAANDPVEASHAIDDHVGRTRLGARLRLLAAAAGYDLDDAHGRAADVLARPSPPPDTALDAELIGSLPEGMPLPREILVDRLRDVLGDVVRHVIAR